MENGHHAGDGSGRLLLKLLGGYEASVDGHPIWFRTRKTFALFTYLALDPRPHRREAIAELLWPGGANRDMVGVAPGSVDVDIDVLRAARQLIRQPRNVALPQELESAVSLYRGPFLAELVFPDAPELEAWIEAHRAYWLNVATELLSLVATLQESAGEPGSSLATLERWTEVSRDEEPAWQRLIETHLSRKDHLAARHAWDGYLAAIRELDVAASEPMTRLYERVLGRADIRRPVKPPMRRWVHPVVHSFAGA